MERMYLEFRTLRCLIVTVFCSISIVFLPAICADSYYADLTILVDPSGYVTIDGYTNYPNLLVKDSQNYTSKDKSYWLLNISIEENFSEFVYTVILPKGASVNYIKSSGEIRITGEQGNLMVKGYGENKKLLIIIQYQIEKDYTSVAEMYGVIVAIIILITAIVLLLLYKYGFLKKKIKKEDIKDIELKGLNERQKQIVKLLAEVNRPLTQTDIQRELKMPKAAVSRNIRTLEKKGIIEKERIGMSNLISLKKR